jgi:hypothetical protein
MYRTFKMLVVLPWIAGCSVQAWGDAPTAAWAAGPSPGIRYDFAWRLSGDRQVAPLQVFDDGERTWLQFAPGQALPAIFARDGVAEQPVPYTRRDPYIVIDGKWPTLVMRGGSLQALANYGGTTAVSGKNAAPAALPPAGLPSMPAVAATAAHVPALRADGAARGTANPAAAPDYRATPADENMRRVLMRWAGAAGWTFGSEHWAVDVDIPLTGTAGFGGDFKQAVRGLVASTEMADRPLQPCFYTNRVLRVVSLSQACDRTAVHGAAAS